MKLRSAPTGATPARAIPARAIPARAILLPALLLALAAAGVIALRAQLPAMPVPRAEFSFPARQSLAYAVDWRVFPAGVATMKLEQDGDRERVSAAGESIGAINLLFRVNDQFHSSFDRRTGCSAGFSKQTQEGRRRIQTDMRFDYSQGKSVMDEKNLVSGTARHIDSPIPACVMDLLSAIFYPASQRLEPGGSFELPVADVNHTVAVTFKVEGREDVKVPLGTFHTVRVQPTADAGVVKNRGNIWIWYSDDERHLPVQMRARLFWGTITFRLTALDPR